MAIFESHPWPSLLRTNDVVQSTAVFISCLRFAGWKWGNRPGRAEDSYDLARVQSHRQAARGHDGEGILKTHIFTNKQESQEKAI